MKALLITIATITVLCLSIYLWLRRGPSLPTSVQSAHVTLMTPYNRDIITEDQITDSSHLDAILNLLKNGRGRMDHKCGHTGTIKFHGDQPFSVDLLPGHDDQFYEFRHNGRCFTIPRTQFIAALKAAGINPEHICLNGHPNNIAESLMVKSDSLIVLETSSGNLSLDGRSIDDGELLALMTLPGGPDLKVRVLADDEEHETTLSEIRDNIDLVFPSINKKRISDEHDEPID